MFIFYFYVINDFPFSFIFPIFQRINYVIYFVQYSLALIFSVFFFLLFSGAGIKNDNITNGIFPNVPVDVFRK